MLTARPKAESKATAPKATRAWTLPEMMIAVTVGVMMLAAISVTYVFMGRTLDATANYEELDRQSRNALDTMMMDIRQAGGLTNYTTNVLYFTNQDGSLLKYAWDGSNFLTYTNASTTLVGCPRGGTLLKGCNTLKFTVFQRTPSNATTMIFWPITNNSPSLVKVIVMDWICRRTNFTSLTDSESVQTAKVVMRN